MSDRVTQESVFPIAQVVETLDTGGAEHLAVKFANAFAARGYPTSLYVTSHEGPLAATVAPDVKVRIFGYRRASILNPVNFGFSIRDGYSRFRDAIVEDGVRLIQTHLPGPNFWGLVLQKRRVCQSIATIHNNKEFSYGSSSSARGVLRRTVYRRIVKDCAATIAVSDQVRTSFLQEIGISPSGADRLISIPNGIEVGGQWRREDAGALRRHLGIPEGHVVFLGVGRVCEQKNFKDLIPVCSLLRERGCPVSVVIAGDGPEMPEFRRLIEAAGLVGMILPLGNVTNVPEILAMADAFVMPSLWEGLPLALLEAMAANLPVVGYRIEGLQDVLREGGSGFLVEVGNHSGMARRIEELTASSGLRRRMGEEGRELVAREYNLERVIDTLDGLYRSILFPLG